MPLSVRRWKQFAESQYAHEREALEFLRSVLPDRDPIYLDSNFEFIADDGSVNEIDALVVTQAGVFLVELKSRGGTVRGNRHLWDWEKDGRTISVDSPLTLINSKARKLAGLLGKQKAFRGERAPWIEALVFLSAPGISVQLHDSERMRICEREPRDKKPGIASALLQCEYFGNESARGPFLDVGASRRFAKALEEAGIRPSQRQRRVGDYVLKELIEENPLFAYQDFQAEHQRLRQAAVSGSIPSPGKIRPLTRVSDGQRSRNFKSLNRSITPAFCEPWTLTSMNSGRPSSFGESPTKFVWTTSFASAARLSRWISASVWFAKSVTPYVMPIAIA